MQALTRDVFPGTPAFQLAGAEGAARLASALGQPRWSHYRTAQQKAAALHFSLNKNHPYVDGNNGNKRLAVTATEWFLWMNGFTLFSTDLGLLTFALGVANDDLSRSDSERWILARAYRRNWTEGRRRRWISSLTVHEVSEIVSALDAEHQLTFEWFATLRRELDTVARGMEASR